MHYPWNSIKEQIKRSGLRNSLLVAFMPTASTSEIMNNSPAFEPHAAMVYKRTNKEGETMIFNKHLIRTLEQMGLWNKTIQDKIVSHKHAGLGDCDQIPDQVKQVFQTCFDISPKILIDHANTRGVFIDQGQSMSLFVAQPTNKLLNKIHFYAWRTGCKTACYYLRRMPAMDAKKIQIRKKTNYQIETDTDSESDQSDQNQLAQSGAVCTMEDGCISCSS